MRPPLWFSVVTASRLRVPDSASAIRCPSSLLSVPFPELPDRLSLAAAAVPDDRLNLSVVCAALLGHVQPTAPRAAYGNRRRPFGFSLSVDARQAAGEGRLRKENNMSYD